MKTKKLMFGAAVAATIALVFPSQALAITTTTAVTASGTQNAKTSMQAGDFIDAKVSAPDNFDTTAQVSREVTRSSLGFTWSGESLQLKTGADADIKSPEGWELEYTTNGTAWSTTKPSSFTTITGVRSTGEYTKTDSNKFQNSTTATLLANATDFSGGAGGDGFDLTFVGDRVYNVFHHGSSIKLDCHLKASGSTCYGAPKEFTGYETPNSSHAWANAAGSKLFVPVYNPTAGNSFGLACIDLATRTNPVLCSTPYVGLGDTNGKQNMATASQVGQKIYMPNPYDWKLYCFDMATAAECSGSGYTSGGFAMQNTATVSSSSIFTAYGRSSAIDGKIFWTSDTYIGCYDPATGSDCAGSSPVAIGASVVSTTGNYSNMYLGSGAKYQFPMFPVRNASNAVIGACYYASAQCFDPMGIVDNSILPVALKSWMKEHPIPHWAASDAGGFGEYDKKIYFPVGPSTTATADVYCFDYNTGAACQGFTGTGLGSQIYSIQADPDSQQPNCMWTNGNAGRITTFNATTGAKGCANASSTVRFTSNKLAPRLSCNEADHISAWGIVQFYSPGISASVLRVTVNDASGSPITGFNDVQITVDQNSDVRGTLDLSSIPASTRPTILVTATITVAGSILSDITATVGYTASDPQMCVVLRAKVKCATTYSPPTLTSVGDGIITTIASRSATSYGSNNVQIAFVSETESTPQTLTGTGDVVCPAVVSGGGGGGSVTVLPVPTAPKAKRPPVTITIGGFRDGSPILTKTIQNKIKAFLKKYNDYPVIETAGFTEGPVVLKTDFALSKARAVNATKYIKTSLKKKFSVVKIKSGQDKVEASKVRRIKITLTDE
jgi:hypothetical protein